MEHEAKFIKIILLDNHHRLTSSTTRNTCFAALLLYKIDQLSKRKLIMMENGEITLEKIDFEQLTTSENLLIQEIIKSKNRYIEKIIYKALHDDKLIKNYLVAVAEECNIEHELISIGPINYKKYLIDDDLVINDFKQLISNFKTEPHIYEYMILCCLNYANSRKKWFDKDVIIELKTIIKDFEENDKWFKYVYKIIKNSRDEDFAALAAIIVGVPGS